MKTILIVILIILTVVVGLYPVLYLIVDMSGGLLSSKSDEVIHNAIWSTTFYIHITFGGIALLSGASQFSTRIRLHYLSIHRSLGKIYIVSVLLSGICGMYIALYATGGIISSAGFFCLAVAWLFTCITAYRAIRQKNVLQHRYWMIRCYAVCWAAVTLRLMLPLAQVFDVDFVSAYRVISWACWVPNLIVAELYVRRLMSSAISSNGQVATD